MPHGQDKRMGPPVEVHAVASERLRLLASIVESSDDAIITESLDGIVTSWNGAAEKLYGYSSEEMIGRPITLLTHEDRRDEMNVILDIRDGQRLGRYESVRVRKDGMAIPVSLTVSPIHDSNGAVVGASSIARDVTALKGAFESAVAAQLVKESERLVELERFQSLMVGRELKMIELKKEIENLRRLVPVDGHEFRDDR